ncbi:hypothetical protein UFOVP134_48 [uncultured Caudovirales phage]|uniref:Uncharacterized protein n=1 Tax=uncultured Caudovirales phage TaxID=2100421 RepID=A0A6J5LKL7_9CAUD|nr:hypothetical protein UFOVP134_48 [uncultured Caudovirales phage]
MSEQRRHQRLIKVLREMGENPDIHPMWRAEAKTAADAIHELAGDLDALRRQGDDHT